jgi:hypothetical protein
MTARSRPRQEGQILVMAAAVLAFLFVPLSILVIDSTLVESSYAQLGETVQAAVEDGASAIDEGSFRQSGGQQVFLDPVAARRTVERSLMASQMPGLDGWTITVTGDTVTATAEVRVQLLAAGTVTIHQTRSASFAFGG